MRWPVIGIILPPGHVGIYIGSNQFIHAPSTGEKIRIDSLNSGYWNNRFKGARDLTGSR
jgi:cell wall-associated NlpC family hydrolase